MKPKLVIVTDLGRLKAFVLNTTPEGTPRLELLESAVFEDALHRVTERVTDFAGRRSASTRRGGAAPTADVHNLKLEIRRRIIKQITEQMKRLLKNQQELPVWLAAPKSINCQILQNLPPALRPRIEVNLTRDLGWASASELLKYFPRPERLA